MNVLIFVMTMLMLLTLMTYAKLETYRSSQVFQVLFEHYMQKDERGYINLAAEDTYNAIKKVAKKTETEPVEETPKPKAEGNARLSLALLKDKSKRDSNPQEWQQAKHILKNLMSILYKDQQFYKEIETERPQFLDELIAALTQAADDVPKEKKWKKTSDIGNLTLGDEKLNNVLYFMLKGAPYKEVVKEGFSVSTEAPASIEENGEPAQAEPSTDEYESPKGYFSLLDFVTFAPNQKIRVYLAPKEVLRAVFPNENIVDDILSERQNLYNQARSGEDQTLLTKTFQSRFDASHDPAIGSDILNYAVTKSRPKNKN